MKLCHSHRTGLPTIIDAHTHVRFSREALDRAAALPNCYVDTSAFKIHCDLAVSEIAQTNTLRFLSNRRKG